ncbi:hypothetical protein H2248_012131 [Termitomyces sp. 'cryptogamus']|nr:hypothetical protein H2248_012131 [Termitomyces sp. 'cryptogamus']
MSITISLSVDHINPDTHFRVVEQSVHHYLNTFWDSDVEGTRYTLTMGNSGFSGVLRFLNDNGENFLVAVGVHNNKRWCDIVPDLQDDQTATFMNPQYYVTGTPYTEKRLSQLAAYEVESTTGRQLSIDFTQAEGNDLAAIILIGAAKA